MRAGLSSTDFPVDMRARQARNDIKKKRTMSPDTNLPPPNIIRALKNTPASRIKMLIQRQFLDSVFMCYKINPDYHVSRSLKKRGSRVQNNCLTKSAPFENFNQY